MNKLARLVLIASLTVFYSQIPFESALADEQQDCEQKLIAAERAGITHGMWVDSSGVHLVVDSETWVQMAYTTKLGLASTVECAIAGPGNRLTAVLIHDHLTNKIVGRYRNSDLQVE